MGMNERKAYEDWFKPFGNPKVVGEGGSPIVADVHYYRGTKQWDFQRFVLDHGFVVYRIPYLKEVFGPALEGVEVGIVARVYGTLEEIATVAEGLEVIELPIPTPHGRYILTFPKGPGAGTTDWLNAVNDVPGWLRDCVLPLPMTEYCDLIVCQGGKGGFKLVVHTLPCAKCGKETPDRRQHYAETIRGPFRPSRVVIVCDECGGDEFGPFVGDCDDYANDPILDEIFDEGDAA